MERTYSVVVNFVDRSRNLVLCPTLADRQRAYQDAARHFENRTPAYLFRDGYEPLPITKASDADVMFADGIQLIGVLRRNTVAQAEVMTCADGRTKPVNRV